VERAYGPPSCAIKHALFVSSSRLAAASNHVQYAFVSAFTFGYLSTTNLMTDHHLSCVICMCIYHHKIKYGIFNLQVEIVIPVTAGCCAQLYQIIDGSAEP
jgi:hypothetical protein